ncbi:MAG: carbohydrate ABC transporter permease [Acidobacteriota bacterium]|nr:carbohydrate ABC transporter permease [Acidobacteriota bacterium]
MLSRTRSGPLVVYGLLVLLAASMLFPFYWMAITSLKGKADVFSTEPKLLPGRQLAERVVDNRRWFFHSGTDNYSQLLAWQRLVESGSGPRGFSRFVLNTVFFALAITLGQVITSSLAAFAFARLRFPGRKQVFFAYLATLMIPATVTMIPSYILLRELGWVNTYQAVILPSVFTAYGTFMLRQFFLTIPREIEDAARIDGCSPLGLYWRIVLPLSTPALAALSIVAFVGSWRTFMWPLIVSSTEDLFNLPLGLTLFRGMYTDPDWPLLMAGSMVMTLPMILVFIVGQRYFVEGIRLGAVKG